MTIQYRVAIPSSVALAALVLACSAPAQVPYDFGDAPDPTYPTRTASNGPRHLDVTQEWISSVAAPVTTTTTETAPLLTDLDFDDGGPCVMFRLDPSGPAMLFVMGVTVHFAPGTQNVTRYLNVLVDVNGNGTWDSGREWPVSNLDLVPAFFAPVTDVVDIRFPVVITNPALLQAWTRITVSTTPVPDGTGAWGLFARGETEDCHAFIDRSNPPPWWVSGGGGGGGFCMGLASAQPVLKEARMRGVDRTTLDGDALLMFPPTWVGRPLDVTLQWGRVRDQVAANGYAGALGDASGTPPSGVALPASSTQWSQPWRRVLTAAPAMLRTPIAGAFPSPGATGDTEFVLSGRFQSRMANGRAELLVLNKGVLPPSDPAVAAFPGAFVTPATVNARNFERAPVLVAELSSTGYDASVALCSNGLEAWISSNRQGTYDILRATRASVDSPWSTPQVSQISFAMGQQEWFADVTEDGQELFFASAATTTAPGDLYTSQRVGSDFFSANPIWAANGPTADDGDPSISADGLTLYFQSNRSGTQQGGIFSITRQNRFQPFSGSPVLVVDTPAWDHSPAIAASGNELFFSINQGSGNSDMFVVRRNDESSPWGQPQRVEQLASPGWEANGQLEQADGEFWFVSNNAAWGGPGTSSVFRTTRLLPGLAVNPDSLPAWSGGTVTLATGWRPDLGPAFDYVVVSFGLAPQPVQLPRFTGEIEIEMLSMNLVSIQPVVGGTSQVQFQVPPGLPGTTLHFQTLRKLLAIPNEQPVPVVSAIDRIRLQ